MAVLPWTFEPSAVPALCDFANLPSYPALEELKRRRQWVAWRYEERNGRMTKPPVSPITGFGASHSKPSTWGTYRQACDYAERKGLPGIGYVLSEDDDLTGADLDKVRDPTTGHLEPWAQAIIELAETYTEISPSGTGLRLIWRGKVEKTLKSDPCHVEIYGSLRYLTITGWHLDGTPEDILPAPLTLTALQDRVAAWKAETAPPAPEPRAAVTLVPTPSPGAGEGSPFFRDVNTAALGRLSAWVPELFGTAARPQPGTGAYRVSSRDLGRDLEEDLSIAPNGCVDFGVHDMGDGRQGRRTPVDLVIQYGGAPDARGAAFWLCGRLGSDPAAFGWAEDDGRGAEIAAGLLAAEIIEAPDGTLANAETGQIVEAPDPDLGELPRDLARPPGLVGALADHMCDTARRPQRALAIGAALTVIGTLAGRHVAGPTGSGTHLYVVGLAPTGAGKDHALQQVLAAMAAAGCTHMIGPGQFISMPAVINFLGRAPLSVCAMDEFGSFLKRINSRRASGFEGAISGVLRTAWGSSFKPMPTPEWAGRAAQVILAPALSIYGVSTPEEFYGALEGGDTSNGVLNRLLVVETRKRPKDRTPRLQDHTIPDSLAAQLGAIPNRAGPMAFTQLQLSDHPPPVYRVPWGPGAEAEFADLVEEINRLCDGDALAQAFYARVAETSVRIATILAIGENVERPVVTAEALRWARGFAMWCARSLQRGGTEHIADSENQSTANAVRRAIREAGGRMKHRDLLRRLNHRVKNRDLIDVVKALAEAEHITIEKVVPEKGGTPTVWYRVL